jgi:hypothetical protein
MVRVLGAPFGSSEESLNLLLAPGGAVNVPTVDVSAGPGSALLPIEFEVWVGTLSTPPTTPDGSIQNPFPTVTAALAFVATLPGGSFVTLYLPGGDLSGEAALAYPPGKAIHTEGAAVITGLPQVTLTDPDGVTSALTFRNCSFTAGLSVTGVVGTGFSFGASADTPSRCVFQGSFNTTEVVDAVDIGALELQNMVVQGQIDAPQMTLTANTSSFEGGEGGSLVHVLAVGPMISCEATGMSFQVEQEINGGNRGWQNTLFRNQGGQTFSGPVNSFICDSFSMTTFNQSNMAFAGLVANPVFLDGVGSSKSNVITGPMGNALGESNSVNLTAQDGFAAGFNNTVNGVAGMALGIGNTCQGAGSAAIGSGCGVTVDNAIAIGNQCITTGVGSFSAGQESTVAGAVGGMSLGYGAALKVGMPSAFAEASGFFDAAGDAQGERVYARGVTSGVDPGESVGLGFSTLAGVTPKIDSSSSYMCVVEAVATRMALGAGTRQAACFSFAFIASATSAGVVSVSAVTDIIAPIVVGAGFVGATLVPSAGSANEVDLTFTIDPGLTVRSRVLASMRMVKLLGD